MIEDRILRKRLEMKRIVVLGAAESGAGAAVLAKKEGFDVFVSDMSAIKDKYKLRKGQRVRIFRATPIHDNFRKLDKDLDPTSRFVFKNWPQRQFHESKITVRFWITTIILAAITIITLKIR